MTKIFKIDKNKQPQSKVAKLVLDNLKTLKLEKYNPFKATELPSLEQLKVRIDDLFKSFTVVASVRDSAWRAFRKSLVVSVTLPVGSPAWESIGVSFSSSLEDSDRKLIEDSDRKSLHVSVWTLVNESEEEQVWDQVYICTCIAMADKFDITISIDRRIIDFHKLGVVLIVTKGKVKVYGKDGMYLGKYDEKDIFDERKE